MLLQAVFFVVGLVALYYGAEWLVKGASRLARAAGIGPLVVGLTVVAFGTSAPELVVSTVAALRGQGDIALGNVVGSNILNLALIVGATAALTPLAVQMRLIFREAPIMIGASLLVPALAWDGMISRLDGVVLLVCFVGYLVFVIRSSRDEPEAVHEQFGDYDEREGAEAPRVSTPVNVALVVVGIAVLVLGAQLMVGAAVFFARAAGVSELVVGLTVVSIGTSLPELATSVVAAIRKEADIALGNAIGSNIFNLLPILGVAALAAPLRADHALFAFEMPVMVAVAVAFPLLAFTRRRLGRVEGGVLLAGYVTFVAVLLVRSTGAA